MTLVQARPMSQQPSLIPPSVLPVPTPDAQDAGRITLEQNVGRRSGVSTVQGTVLPEYECYNLMNVRKMKRPNDRAPSLSSPTGDPQPPMNPESTRRGATAGAGQPAVCPGLRIIWPADVSHVFHLLNRLCHRYRRAAPHRHRPQRRLLGLQSPRPMYAQGTWWFFSR